MKKFSYPAVCVMHRIITLTVIVIAFSLSSALGQMRNFTGSNGKIIEAEFLGFDKATQIVKLRLKDGREQNVKLDLFSTESQQWIKAGGKDADNPFGDDAPLSPPTREELERKASERKVLTIKDVKYAFRWCPPGKFMMGSPTRESGRDGDET